jgi:hypothetical protein
MKPLGSFCGSVFLDRAFEDHIRGLLGDEYNIIKEKDKVRMMSDFELAIKPSFRLNPDDNPKLMVDLRGVKENIPRGIEDESITLKAFEGPDT